MHDPSTRFNIQLFISISCIRESLIIISGASKIQVHALMHIPHPQPPLFARAHVCVRARAHTPIAEPLPTPQGGRTYRLVALPIRIVVITCNRRNYNVKPALYVVSTFLFGITHYGNCAYLAHVHQKCVA